MQLILCVPLRKVRLFSISGKSFPKLNLIVTEYNCPKTPHTLKTFCTFVPIAFTAVNFLKRIVKQRLNAFQKTNILALLDVRTSQKIKTYFQRQSRAKYTGNLQGLTENINLKRKFNNTFLAIFDKITVKLIFRQEDWVFHFLSPKSSNFLRPYLITLKVSNSWKQLCYSCVLCFVITWHVIVVFSQVCNFSNIFFWFFKPYTCYK